MGVTQFVRKARQVPPEVPGGELVLNPPPVLVRPVATPIVVKLLPVVMVVAVVGMLVLMFTSGSAMMRNPMMMMFPMMMMLSMVGMFMAGGRSGGPTTAELNEDRRDYLRYLDSVRRDVNVVAEKQKAALYWSHPDPHGLESLVGTPRMWERRPGDRDFAHARLGLGTHFLAKKLVRPETGPVEDLEPVSAVALRKFLQTRAVVHELPTGLALRRFPAVSFGGDRELARGLIRAVISGLAIFHSPEEIRIAVVTEDPEGPDWSWLKWLPHATHPKRQDKAGPSRLLFTSLALLERVFDDELSSRPNFSRTVEPNDEHFHLVVVIDTGFVSGSEILSSDVGVSGVTVLDLNDSDSGLAARRGLRLIVEAGTLRVKTRKNSERIATPDYLSCPEASAIARSAAGFTVNSSSSSDFTNDKADELDLLALLRISDASEIAPQQVWKPRSKKERLRVPIGVDLNGQMVNLDIKESAEGGYGPHGLCIGATGSGKSELLRTLVLSLAITHSPDALNLILVDFKGGATFLGLEDLPHVSAVITNLEDEAALVDRMKDALAGEMNRRQELLRTSGNFANVGEYEKARRNGMNLDPLPALFVVVDEFTELLVQQPEMRDQFVAIGRLGRSLHVHLLLASQKLEEGRLGGLDSHLSYRIALKTFSASESRNVIGVTSAFQLPNLPGSAYMQAGSDDLTRFRASYVSGLYIPTVLENSEVGREEVEIDPVRFVAEYDFLVDESSKDVDTEETAAAELDVNVSRQSQGGALESSFIMPLYSELLSQKPTQLESGSPSKAVSDSSPIDSSGKSVERSILDVVVDRLKGHGRPAHQVWLPPLEESVPLNSLCEMANFSSEVHRRTNFLVPFALLDKPYFQRRDIHHVDLASGSGNLAIVGGPHSGKSLTARTIALSLAALNHPYDVQMMFVDFGGGAMTSLKDLPHSSAVANQSEPEQVSRIIAELKTLLSYREQKFAQWSVESVENFRARRIQGTLPSNGVENYLDRFGDVFLFIDGWGAFKDKSADLEPDITSLVSQGLTYGIHVVVCSSRWRDIRSSMLDFFGSRIELRLGEPHDSVSNAKVAATVPAGRPGRGISTEALHFLVALPRLDGVASVDGLAAATASAIREISDNVGSTRAAVVRSLPRVVDYSQVPQRREGQQAYLGIAERDLSPVLLSFRKQPHLLIAGEDGCGKSTVLSGIVHQLIHSNTSKEAKFLLVDYRRGLLGQVPAEYLAGYASSSEQGPKMMRDLAGLLKKRMPPKDVTPQALKERSWWSGPEVYVIIDDLELVESGAMGAVDPLIDLLPVARDIGLHMLVSRGAAGLSRSIYRGTVSKLRENQADTFLMSGDPAEGRIAGKQTMIPLPPGRGILFSRARGQDLVQTYAGPSVPISS